MDLYERLKKQVRIKESDDEDYPNQTGTIDSLVSDWDSTEAEQAITVMKEFGIPEDKVLVGVFSENPDFKKIHKVYRAEKPLKTSVPEESAWSYELLKDGVVRMDHRYSGSEYIVPVEIAKKLGVQTDSEVTEKTTDDCKNYRRDTGSCRTGCPQDEVAKEDPCPYVGNQSKCSCYKG